MQKYLYSSTIETPHQRTLRKQVCSNHFKKTNVLLNDFKNEYSKQAKFFRFWLDNPQLNNIRIRFLKKSFFLQHIINRFVFILTNRNYGHDLWNNRYRIIAILKAKF